MSERAHHLELPSISELLGHLALQCNASRQHLELPSRICHIDGDEFPRWPGIVSPSLLLGIHNFCGLFRTNFWRNFCGLFLVTICRYGLLVLKGFFMSLGGRGPELQRKDKMKGYCGCWSEKWSKSCRLELMFGLWVYHDRLGILP